MKHLQKILFVAFLCMLNHLALFSQNDSINLSLLIKQDFRNPKLENKRAIVYGVTDNKTFVQKINPVNAFLSGMMFLYQGVLSQQISADCLYSPSCSEYSRQLFVRYGIFRGLIFTSDRLMRCDRIAATTINHVSIDKTDGKVHETTERYNLKNSTP